MVIVRLPRPEPLWFRARNDNIMAITNKKTILNIGFYFTDVGKGYPHWEEGQEEVDWLISNQNFFLLLFKSRIFYGTYIAI